MRFEDKKSGAFISPDPGYLLKLAKAIMMFLYIAKRFFVKCSEKGWQ